MGFLYSFHNITLKHYLHFSQVLSNLFYIYTMDFGLPYEVFF